MKRTGAILVAIIVSMMTAAVSFAQMTDDQVIKEVKSGLAAGKSQSQIGKELLAKGVTQAQAERIKAKLDAANNSESSSITERALDRGAISRSSRAETLNNGYDNKKEKDTKDIWKAFDAKDGRNAGDSLKVEKGDSVKIFGHNIFNTRYLTFEPNENAATPESYVLGPGDQLNIQLWGISEAAITQTISPEGIIYINQVGPVHLSGLTIKAATAKVKKALSSIYSSVEGASSYVSITLANIRTIRVNIMGDVNIPGTYRLSSFSTVFNAIYRAGGVTPTGSLRAIKVMRGGDQIATVDLYGYLFEGKSDSDISLKEGDVVIVPSYVSLVNIDGCVKRPMTYEMKDGETLKTLIGYAGGFSGNAFTGSVLVMRQTGKEREVATVKDSEAGSFAMMDGDSVKVSKALDRFANKIEVRGYVFRPGMYQLGGDIATVKQLVNQAGGLKEDAFTSRAMLMRQKDNLDLESLPVNIGGIMDGSVSDILLRKNDILVVSSIHELEDRGTVSINGYVAEPGIFPYADNMTVEDLILEAGGLMDGASFARVDVARRVVDKNATAPSDTIGQTFSFAIEDGFTIKDNSKRFILMPYDVVSVRKSPAYSNQEYVSIEGEVAFPGEYVLLNKAERISSIIERSGGLTNAAYIKGVRITRHSNESNSDINESVNNVLSRGGSKDSINVAKLSLDTYNVAVNLEKAMAAPGSDDDIVLEEGDRIRVPKFINTVRIEGEVMFPTATLFQNKESVRYYIEQAGGFTTEAKRSKVFVVYPDGSARRSSLAGANVIPGSVIIVPVKPKNKKMTTAEWLSIATTTASLSTTIATIANLFK